MTLSYIYSFVLFITFAIYFILGMYILSLNTGSKLNRLYCIACLSLSIWSFCFSITNSAPDYETAILWRRLASLGYGTVYSILLHFSLILTERTAVLKNKWIYVVLYFPAAVNVIAFGYNASAKEQYNLIYTAAGWVNISANGWGMFILTCTIFALPQRDCCCSGTGQEGLKTRLRRSRAISLCSPIAWL